MTNPLRMIVIKCQQGFVVANVSKKLLFLVKLNTAIQPSFDKIKIFLEFYLPLLHKKK